MFVYIYINILHNYSLLPFAHDPVPVRGTFLPCNPSLPPSARRTVRQISHRANKSDTRWTPHPLVSLNASRAKMSRNSCVLPALCSILRYPRTFECPRRRSTTRRSTQTLLTETWLESAAGWLSLHCWLRRRRAGDRRLSASVVFWRSNSNPVYAYPVLVGVVLSSGPDTAKRTEEKKHANIHVGTDNQQEYRCVSGRTFVEGGDWRQTWRSVKSCHSG